MCVTVDDDDDVTPVWIDDYQVDWKDTGVSVELLLLLASQ